MIVSKTLRGKKDNGMKCYLPQFEQKTILRTYVGFFCFFFSCASHRDKKNGLVSKGKKDNGIKCYLPKPMKEEVEIKILNLKFEI